MLRDFSSGRSVGGSARAQRGLSGAIGTKASEGGGAGGGADPEFLNVKNTRLFFCFNAVELFFSFLQCCTCAATSGSVLSGRPYMTASGLTRGKVVHLSG